MNAIPAFVKTSTTCTTPGEGRSGASETGQGPGFPWHLHSLPGFQPFDKRPQTAILRPREAPSLFSYPEESRRKIMKAGGIIKAASFYGPAEREPSSAVEGKKKQPSACRIQQPPALLPGSPKKAFRSLRRQRKIRTTFCLHLPRLPADIFLQSVPEMERLTGAGHPVPLPSINACRGRSFSLPYTLIIMPAEAGGISREISFTDNSSCPVVCCPSLFPFRKPDCIQRQPVPAAL